MRRFLTMVGLGLGLALGGGLVYSLITNELARLFIIAVTMFILGATIVGGCVVAGNFLLARAFTGRQERTTVNYRPSVAPPRADAFPPWSSAPTLPAPSPWQAVGPYRDRYPVPHISAQPGDGEGAEDDYVA
jgi:hypothetical protein